jgi:hypothetical protein
MFLVFLVQVNLCEALSHHCNSDLRSHYLISSSLTGSMALKVHFLVDESSPLTQTTSLHAGILLFALLLIKVLRELGRQYLIYSNMSRE